MSESHATLLRFEEAVRDLVEIAQTENHMICRRAQHLAQKEPIEKRISPALFSMHGACERRVPATTKIRQTGVDITCRGIGSVLQIYRVGDICVGSTNSYGGGRICEPNYRTNSLGSAGYRSIRALNMRCVVRIRTVRQLMGCTQKVSSA